MTLRSAASRLWLVEPWIFLAALPWLLFTEVFPIAAAVALIVLLFLIGARVIAGGTPIKATSFSLPPFVILFVLPCSLWAAPDFEFALPKLTVILAGIIAFALFISRPRAEDGVRWALWITLGAAVAIMPLAIVGGEWTGKKIFELDPLYRAFPRLVNQVPRSVDGGFHPNEIAGTVVLLLFPVIGLALDHSQLRYTGRLPMRWGLRLLAGALVVLLLLTQSRGAWTAGWLAGLLFVGRNRHRLQLALLTGGILALALLLGVRAPTLGAPVSETTVLDFETLVSALDRSTVNDPVNRLSWRSRIEIWTRAGMMLRDYPILSSGLYQFGLISSSVYGYTLVAPEFKLYHAHNLYAQTAADFGLSGIVFWVLVVAWLLEQWQRPMRWWERGVAAGLTGFMLHGLTDAIPLGQKPTVLFWILIVPLALRSLSGIKPTSQPPVPQLLAGGSLLAAMAVPLWLPVWHANVAALVLDRFREAPVHEQVLAWRWRRPDDAIRAGLFQFAAGDEVAAATAWAQEPRAEDLLVWRGRLALARDRLPEAHFWFGQALQHPHASTSAALGMAQVQLEMERPDEAAVTLRTGLRLPGTPAQYAAAWQQIGILLAEQGRWDEAAEAFRASLQQNPTADSAFELGVANLQRGNNREAEATFATARHLAGDSPVFLTRIGEAYRRAGDREGAASWASLVMKIYPTSPLGYRLQARLTMDAREWGAAITWLKRGLQQAPADDSLWYELARAYLARGEPEAALPAVQSAITHSKDTRPLYFILLGDVHRRLGNRAGAEEAYQTALRLSPDLPIAKERLRHLTFPDSPASTSPAGAGDQTEGESTTR